MEAKNNDNSEEMPVKKKFSIAKFLVLVLFIYLIVSIILTIYNEPIRHYDISGNKILKDIDIIRELNLENYPSFVQISPHKLEKKLETNPYVASADIHYNWDLSLKIEVVENRPMFYVKLENKMCLSNGEEIDVDENIIGVPTLLNTTPEEAKKTLAKNLSTLDEGIIYMINDIEYKPSYNKDNQIIDDYRFLLSMNDKNMVYINAKHLKSLNKYLDIIATNKITMNGTLYLDGTEDNYFFKKFGT